MSDYAIGAAILKRKLKNLQVKLEQLEKVLCPECKKKFRVIFEEKV